MFNEERNGIIYDHFLKNTYMISKVLEKNTPKCQKWLF